MPPKKIHSYEGEYGSSDADVSLNLAVKAIKLRPKRSSHNEDALTKKLKSKMKYKIWQQLQQKQLQQRLEIQNHQQEQMRTQFQFQPQFKSQQQRNITRSQNENHFWKSPQSDSFLRNRQVKITTSKPPTKPLSVTVQRQTKQAMTAYQKEWQYLNTKKFDQKELANILAAYVLAQNGGYTYEEPEPRPIAQKKQRKPRIGIPRDITDPRNYPVSQFRQENIRLPLEFPKKTLTQHNLAQINMSQNTNNRAQNTLPQNKLAQNTSAQTTLGRNVIHKEPVAQQILPRNLQREQKKVRNSENVQNCKNRQSVISKLIEENVQKGKKSLREEKILKSTKSGRSIHKVSSSQLKNTPLVPSNNDLILSTIYENKANKRKKRKKSSFSLQSETTSKLWSGSTLTPKSSKIFPYEVGTSPNFNAKESQKIPNGFKEKAKENKTPPNRAKTPKSKTPPSSRKSSATCIKKNKSDSQSVEKYQTAKLQSLIPVYKRCKKDLQSIPLTNIEIIKSFVDDLILMKKRSDQSKDVKVLRKVKNIQQDMKVVTEKEKPKTKLARTEPKRKSQSQNRSLDTDNTYLSTDTLADIPLTSYAETLEEYNAILEPRKTATKSKSEKCIKEEVESKEETKSASIEKLSEKHKKLKPKIPKVPPKIKSIPNSITIRNDESNEKKIKRRRSKRKSQNNSSSNSSNGDTVRTKRKFHTKQDCSEIIEFDANTDFMKDPNGDGSFNQVSSESFSDNIIASTKYDITIEKFVKFTKNQISDYHVNTIKTDAKKSDVSTITMKEIFEQLKTCEHKCVQTEFNVGAFILKPKRDNWTETERIVNKKGEYVSNMFEGIQISQKSITQFFSLVDRLNTSPASNKVLSKLSLRAHIRKSPKRQNFDTCGLFYVIDSDDDEKSMKKTKSEVISTQNVIRNIDNVILKNYGKVETYLNMVSHYYKLIGETKISLDEMLHDKLSMDSIEVRLTTLDEKGIYEGSKLIPKVIGNNLNFEVRNKNQEGIKNLVAQRQQHQKTFRLSAKRTCMHQKRARFIVPNDQISRSVQSPLEKILTALSKSQEVVKKFPKLPNSLKKSTQYKPILKPKQNIKLLPQHNSSPIIKQPKVQRRSSQIKLKRIYAGHHIHTRMDCHCKEDEHLDTKKIELLFDEEEDYHEHHLEPLIHELKADKEIKRAGSELSLPPEQIETDRCDSRLEIPWLQISLPPPGSLQIKNMQGHPAKVHCDCWRMHPDDDVYQEPIMVEVLEAKSYCNCTSGGDATNMRARIKPTLDGDDEGRGEDNANYPPPPPPSPPPPPPTPPPESSQNQEDAPLDTPGGQDDNEPNDNEKKGEEDDEEKGDGKKEEDDRTPPPPKDNEGKGEAAHKNVQINECEDVKELQLVYDNPYYSSNEPYMDSLYGLYPDDCDTPCGPETEIPWQDILVPRNVKLKGVSRHRRKSECASASNRALVPVPKQEITKYHRPKTEHDEFQIELSFTEILVERPSAASSKKGYSCLSIQVDTPPQPFGQGQTCACFGDVNRNKQKVRSPKSSHRKHEGKSSPKDKIVSRGSRHRCHTPKQSKKEEFLTAVQTCELEIIPIRTALNELKSKIQNLNIPEVSDVISGVQSSGRPQVQSASTGCVSFLDQPMLPMAFPLGPPPAMGFGLPPPPSGGLAHPHAFPPPGGFHPPGSFCPAGLQSPGGYPSPAGFSTPHGLGPMFPPMGSPPSGMPALGNFMRPQSPTGVAKPPATPIKRCKCKKKKAASTNA